MPVSDCYDYKVTRRDFYNLPSQSYLSLNASPTVFISSAITISGVHPAGRSFPLPPCLPAFRTIASHNTFRFFTASSVALATHNKSMTTMRSMRNQKNQHALHFICDQLSRGLPTSSAGGQFVAHYKLWRLYDS